MLMQFIRIHKCKDGGLLSHQLLQRFLASIYLSLGSGTLVSQRFVHKKDFEKIKVQNVE